jgi:DNA (cytosine-5)-methyltransferase 1
MYTGNTEVVDYIYDRVYHHPQGYMFHRKLWLLYRNEWFDEYIRTLTLDVFDFYRDRAITKSKVHDSGRIRVLRSKNIEDDGSVVSIPGYDKYIDDESTFAVGRFLNSRSIIMPNFTYNTRATILPDNSIPNGSIAILLPKRPLGKIDLGLYATPDFRKYYAIVESYSKFTLNIDDCSIYYIGIKNGTI